MARMAIAGLIGLQEEVELLRPVADRSHACRRGLVCASLSRSSSPCTFTLARGNAAAVRRIPQHQPERAEPHRRWQLPTALPQELLSRHASRDPQLRTQLDKVLDRIDLLGTTDELDVFVYLLCERAGIAVCPRGGVANIRDAASARGLQRKVLQQHASSGAVRKSDGTERMEPLPNASSPTHRRAVEAAGWLDAYMHARARRSLRAAVEAGGAATAAARRLALHGRTLPPDESTGCLNSMRRARRGAELHHRFCGACIDGEESGVVVGRGSTAAKVRLVGLAEGTPAGSGRRRGGHGVPVYTCQRQPLINAKGSAATSTRATREAMQGGALLSLRREAATRSVVGRAGDSAYRRRCGPSFSIRGQREEQMAICPMPRCARQGKASLVGKQPARC